MPEYPLMFLSKEELLSGWSIPGKGVMECPECGFYYAHPHPPEVIDGKDNSEAGWGGRGSLIRILFEGECGHSWYICFGFHKGQVIAFWERGPDLEGGSNTEPPSLPAFITTQSFR